MSALPGCDVTTRFEAAAGSTVKAFDVPVCVPPVLVAVRVEPAPASVSVTAWLARTPAEKAAVAVAQPLLQFRLEVRMTVPVKPVTVLLLPS